MAKSTEEILTDMNGVFTRVLDRPGIVLNATTTAAEVEGWDSMTHTVLLSEIEKHFGVKFALKEVVRFQNVGDICRALEKRLGAAG
jgi:acyl carrier protein